MFTLSVVPAGIWTRGLPLGEPSPIELTGRLTKVFEIEKLLQAVDGKARGTEILWICLGEEGSFFNKVERW